MKFILILFFGLVLCQNVISQPYIWDRVYGNLPDTSYNSFKGISKADSLNIMAVIFSSEKPFPGYNRILKSTDAGMTWLTVYKNYIIKNAPIDPQKISYPTKDFCIVTCDKNYFIKTSDGGNNWKTMKLDIPDYNFGIRKISLLNEKDGIMSTLRTLIISHDGFETYDTIPLPINANIANIYMLSPHSIFLLLNYNYGQLTNDISFYKTSDEGKNWTEVSQIKYQWFHNMDMKFTDSLFGYIVGDRLPAFGDPEQNVIFRTTNGGIYWNKVLDTIVPWKAWGLQTISVLDRKNAIALGQFGVIYWTHDGGESWQLDSNAAILKDEPATLYPCILGTHTALIADFWARIFRSSLKGTDVVDEKENNTNEYIYPNPARDYIVIQPSEGWQPSEGSDIQVFNTLGENVLTVEQTPPSVQRYDITKLSPGIYFIKIGNRVEKFVKM
jgi:photosystem II stability/assembly factor-like uncharacterized protein